MSHSIAQEIKDFIISNFLYGQDAGTLANDQSLLENGIIDSTGVLELVAFLEQHFGIAIADRELSPENLDSVDNATAFVGRKLEGQGATVAR